MNAWPSLHAQYNGWLKRLHAYADVINHSSWVVKVQGWRSRSSYL